MTQGETSFRRTMLKEGIKKITGLVKEHILNRSYECNGYGHISTDYGNRKNSAGDRKTYKATTWSDSDEEKSSKRGDKNFAFITSVQLDSCDSDSDSSSGDDFENRRRLDDKFVQTYRPLR